MLPSLNCPAGLGGVVEFGRRHAPPLCTPSPSSARTEHAIRANKAAHTKNERAILVFLSDSLGCDRGSPAGPTKLVGVPVAVQAWVG